MLVSADGTWIWPPPAGTSLAMLGSMETTLGEFLSLITNLEKVCPTVSGIPVWEYFLRAKQAGWGFG